MSKKIVNQNIEHPKPNFITNHPQNYKNKNTNTQTKTSTHQKPTISQKLELKMCWLNHLNPLPTNFLEVQKLVM
jgi:hypothetical protein